ncbi:hypothetical protein A0H81_05658 [Grifola frondosa]|uniref:Uncharacterized protein n=1 Tax=Grifola frondosa TaxID=5627 RepID=A0A1C7MCC7_GRIFR|nr:hypothetical protein A0H81_05658 [Grifola frondosa]
MTSISCCDGDVSVVEEGCIPSTAILHWFDGVVLHVKDVSLEGLLLLGVNHQGHQLFERERRDISTNDLISRRELLLRMSGRAGDVVIVEETSWCRLATQMDTSWTIRTSVT